jgi:hypothetical protein
VRSKRNFGLLGEPEHLGLEPQRLVLVIDEHAVEIDGKRALMPETGPVALECALGGSEVSPLGLLGHARAR